MPSEMNSLGKRRFKCLIIARKAAMQSQRLFEMASSKCQERSRSYMFNFK